MPSGEKVGSWSSFQGPPTSEAGRRRSTGSPTKMSPFASYGIRPLTRRPERRRHAALRAGVQRERCRQQERDQGEDAERPPRDAGGRRPRGCEVHGEPPFEGGPGGSLSGVGGPPEDVGEVVGRVRPGDVSQRHRELALEAVELGHASRPSATGTTAGPVLRAGGGAQDPDRPMQPRLRGPQRDPEGGRHLRQRDLEEVVQDDDRAPRGLEARERAVEEVAIDHLAAEVASGRGVERRELDLDHPAPTASDEVEARVDEQSMEPAVERTHVAQRGQVAPAADERLLDRVPREVVVPDDQPGGCVQPPDGRAGQRREGVMIAPLRSLDETALVHWRPLRWRDAGGRARMLGRGPTANCSRASAGYWSDSVVVGMRMRG